MIRRPLMQVKSNKESHATNDNYRTFSGKKVPFHPPFKRLACIAQFTLINKGYSPFTYIKQVKILCIFIIEG